MHLNKLKRILAYSYVPHMLCDYCESSGHDVHTCSYHDYIDGTCASVEKRINEMTNQMVETIKQRIAECSHCFSHSMEDIHL